MDQIYELTEQYPIDFDKIIKLIYPITEEKIKYLQRRCGPFIDKYHILAKLQSKFSKEKEKEKVNVKYNNRYSKGPISGKTFIR